MHPPIFLENVSLYFADRVCFEYFSAEVPSKSRIAIIGKNGSGKSSLMRFLHGSLLPSSGHISMPTTISIGYVEQIASTYNTLSGSQNFNKKLSQALALQPDLLLLDEPTNHLDYDNRKSLLQMLARYQGTLIIISHDISLLRSSVNCIWHITDKQRVHKFYGSYDNYLNEMHHMHHSMDKKIATLKQYRKNVHEALMKEQKRAKKRKVYGEKKYAGDKLSLRAVQERGEKATSKNKKSINRKMHKTSKELLSYSRPKSIKYKFSLTANLLHTTLISIHKACIGYTSEKSILNDIHLHIHSEEKVAIYGKNATGKSTLLKAIAGNKHIIATGIWHLPNSTDIGYIDQHYNILTSGKSVINHIEDTQPHWNNNQIRCHLNDFLFSKNNEVEQLIDSLSGGEKARLSLSIIAANPPKLLLLDEITNNIDLDTKEHLTKALAEYPGAIVLVSHDKEFIRAIGTHSTYTTINGTLTAV